MWYLFPGFYEMEVIHDLELKIKSQEIAIQNLKRLVSSNTKISRIESENLELKAKLKRSDKRAVHNERNFMRMKKSRDEIRVERDVLKKERDVLREEIEKMRISPEPEQEVCVEPETFYMETSLSTTTNSQLCNFSQTKKSGDKRKKFQARVNNYKTMSKSEQDEVCTKCYFKFVSQEHVNRL